MQLIEDLAWWHHVSCGIFFLLQFALEESVSLMVAVGNATALRKHHSQESGHALMHGAQLKQQAFTSRSANSSSTSNSGWHGGAHCLTKAAAKIRQHSRRFRRLDNNFSSIRQHFLKFLRLDNISRRFGNLFLFPVKIENVVDSFLVDSTTFLETCSTRQVFPFWREI